MVVNACKGMCNFWRLSVRNTEIGPGESSDECMRCVMVSIVFFKKKKKPCHVLCQSRPASVTYPRTLLAILYILEFLSVFYLNRMPLQSQGVCVTALLRGYVSNFSHRVLVFLLVSCSVF